MTERPFVHKKALTDVYLNFIFQDEIAKFLPKLIKYKGIINVGVLFINLLNNITLWLKNYF